MEGISLSAERIILLQKGTQVQIGSYSCFVLGIIETMEEKVNKEKPLQHYCTKSQK